ncbi:MAG: creatininase family protein [Bacteroidetes bacterium]|nr:creatininase family protein [Bacteroidota bacterium]
MSEHSYHVLRPDEIDRLRSESPVAFVPWGAIEWHSYHNPVGLDGMIADGLIRSVARRIGGIVFPPLYVATDTIKPFKGFPHSIEFRPETVGAVCKDILYQLRDEQFKVIVILSGHAGGGHTDVLNSEVAAFNEAVSDCCAILFTPFAPIQEKHPANHAADGETSLQLYYDGTHVDLSRLPHDRVATLDEDGVWGSDPRNASARKGSDIESAFVDATVAQIAELLKQVQNQ